MRGPLGIATLIDHEGVEPWRIWLVVRADEKSQRCAVSGGVPGHQTVGDRSGPVGASCVDGGSLRALPRLLTRTMAEILLDRNPWPAEPGCWVFPLLA